MTRQHQTLKMALALVLATGAIAPAAASARFDNYPVHIPPATNANGSPDVGQPGTRVVLVHQGGGFDWGDAAIGAAGGLGLSILGVAGGQVVRRRRDRRATGSMAAIG